MHDSRRRASTQNLGDLGPLEGGRGLVTGYWLLVLFSLRSCWSENVTDVVATTEEHAQSVPKQLIEAPVMHRPICVVYIIKLVICVYA